MGLLSKPKPNIFKILQFIIIKLYLKFVVNLFFLGRKEKELASAKYPNHLDKLAYVPFALIQNFGEMKKLKKDMT